MKWFSSAVLLILCSPLLFAQTLTPAAETVLRQARQLLARGDVSNAVILLESQLSAAQGNTEYLQTIASAYQQQFSKCQREGKLPQASAIWDKLQVLQPELQKQPAALAQQKDNITVLPDNGQNLHTQAVSKTETPMSIDAAEAAFARGQYQQACDCYARVMAEGGDLPDSLKEKYAYCKLRQIAERLNALDGNPGEERSRMEKEVRHALTLAPRLEFGNELLRRLSPPANLPAAPVTRLKHLPTKEQGWSLCETTHFRIYHQNAKLAEQVAEKAEATRAAVIHKWLGHDVAWSQPCQIYVHPTAESYHRQSGMPATAPGHSDYDADKYDASVIHYRRVFVRADHPHMLHAILPHEVTHVVLNGQFGRKLLPRWADEGMAVLSEPYSRIDMHLEPLPRSYQEGKALRLQELLSVEDYPQDRSKVACFYGQSVCLVEYLTSLRGPRAFVNFMRDANRDGETVSLQKHYQMSLEQLEAQLQDWIVSKQMPTLYRVAQAQ